jgi:hypothetical protein
VQRVHEPWWLNFLLHPTFLVEVALVTTAVGLALTARHPAPRYVGWMPEALRWMRDWALLGGITCAVAPSVASLGPFPLVPEAFCATAAVLGTLTGAAVGLFLYGLTLRTPERSRVAVAAVVWPPVLGGWGAAVSASAASLSAPGMELLAVFCGSVAALLQAAWFAPAYARQAGRKGWRWPLLGLALVTSWGAGLVAVSTVFGFMDLL